MRLKHMISLLVCIVFLTGCNGKSEYEVFEMEYESGDTKFYKDGLLVTSNTNVQIIDSKTKNVNELENMRSAWVDSIPDENIIVYSSPDLSVNVTKLDNELSEEMTNTIIDGTNLRIDPTITKMNEEYFVTVTKIEGNINNADPKKENGVYTIELYSSKDLQTWVKVADVISTNHNLEDVDVLIQGSEIFVIYELEEYDHGASSIMLTKSFDQGRTWADPIVLLDQGADNEPASFFTDADGYLLFYSSDEDNLGMSYDGAKSYVNRYDVNLKLENHELLPTTKDENMILYDVKRQNQSWVLLYASDYLQNRTLRIDVIDEIYK